MSHRNNLFAFGAIALLVLTAWISPAWAQCGDGQWTMGEWCGQDAWVDAGVPEMNHDCIVDVIDLSLFAAAFPPNPYNISADFNNDGMINIMDYSILAAGWGKGALGTCPGYHVLQQGDIFLSFSANPATIVSTAAQGVGANTVYVVVNGWQTADVMQFSVEFSPNMLLTTTSSPLAVSTVSPFTCTATQAQYTAWTSAGGAWPAGPVVVAQFDYFLISATPGWIKFVALQSVCQNDPGPEWGRTLLPQMYRFVSIKNAAINGGAIPVTTGIEDGRAPKSSRSEILAIAPNPFNPATTVSFTLPEAMPVTAGVVSVDGVAIRTLAREQMFGAGVNQLTWDGRDDHGSLVASGVYFVQLRTRRGTDVKRAVLLK